MKTTAIIVLMLVSSAAWPVQYTLEIVATNFNYPWSLAFLPCGDFLVVERNGGLRRVTADGAIGKPIAGVPQAFVAGQGGLFDVLLDTNFAQNSRIYLSYAKGSASSNATAVVQATLAEHKLVEVSELLEVHPQKDTPVHYGAKMAWLPDNTILITSGDGFDHREAAQDPASELGKVLRITQQGTAAADHPFSQAPRVFTYGHRNPQGIAVARDGTVYAHEHGPQGGDEINVLTAGNNYGWPAITYGIDYNGAKVSPHTQWPGMVQPLVQWTPSIAPSGLAIYEGDLFPQWSGDLFVGALAEKSVHHIMLEQGAVVGQEVLFRELDARIRDVRSGPDGALYLLTDDPAGQLIRVVPSP